MRTNLFIILDEAERRTLASHLGEKGLATRRMIKQWADEVLQGRLDYLAMTEKATAKVARGAKAAAPVQEPEEEPEEELIAEIEADLDLDLEDEEEEEVVVKPQAATRKRKGA